MDFAKFVSMLATRSLYFARIDQLGDAHEGCITRAIYTKRQSDARDTEEAGEKVLGFYGSMTEIAREQLYVNCWCMQDGESDALWKIYGSAHGGLAIRSTYAKLARVLPPQDNIGQVRYIDYETETFGDDNLMHCAMHKRRVFQYEQEVRAVRWLQAPAADASDEVKARWRQTTHVTDGRSIIGIRVEVPLEALIDNVVVSPYSPDWFGVCVTAVTKAFDINLPVIDSEMRSNALVAGYPYTEKVAQNLREMMTHVAPVRTIDEITLERVVRPQRPGTAESSMPA